MPVRIDINIHPLALLALGASAIAAIVYLAGSSDITARLTQRDIQHVIPWVTITEQDVRDGVTAQPDVHILLHIPAEIRSITRSTLFGRRGKTIRYWGYCLPQDPKYTREGSGFPGPMYLSEKEREVQIARIRAEEGQGQSIYENLTNRGVSETGELTGAIQHEKNVFFGGDTCYLMAEQSLPIGLDDDGDGLNTQLEIQYSTDLLDSDTDDDGIEDGDEVFTLKSIPTTQDSDGDGLPDGTEDKNRNGRYDSGETSPINIDTDNDGLCDGHCVIEANGSNGFIAPEGFVPKDGGKETWEDKNLNGVVDENETDPLKVDTDGDGILDEQEFFFCILPTGEDCS